MHPILASASKLGMYLLAYLPIGIVLVIGLGRRDAWGTAAAFFLPLTMLYAFIGLSAYYLCLAFPIDSDHPLWRAMPAHMCAAASVGALCVGAAWLWAAVLESLNCGKTIRDSRGACLRCSRSNRASSSATTSRTTSATRRISRSPCTANATACRMH